MSAAFPPLPRRALLGALALAGCTSARAPMGPVIGEPHVDPDALVMADGIRLPLYAWMPAGGPPRAVIIALHGMNEYSRSFAEDPAAWFAAAGIGVYAYDQRGFGASPNRGIWPGHRTMAADATTAARLIGARHPGVPLIMMGESMGGAVLLVAGASADPPPVQGYVLLAPAVRGRQSLGPVARFLLDLMVSVVPMMGVVNSAPGFQPTDNVDAWRRWSRDPMLLRETRMDTLAGLVELMDAAIAAAPFFRSPALILYGGRDNLVPPEPTRALLASLPHAAPQRVGFYPDGYHMLLRDRAGIVVAQDIVNWIANQALPLPSGADIAARNWLST